MGSSRRSEAWFLGVSLVLVVESFPWPWDLFLACDCGKCLEIRGFVGCQSYFVELLKYIFTYSQIIIGNFSAMFYLALVASKQGTPTITKPTMKYLPTINLWETGIQEAILCGQLKLQCGQWVKCGGGKPSRFVKAKKHSLWVAHPQGSPQATRDRFNSLRSIA